jgi:hypothetical protein
MGMRFFCKLVMKWGHCCGVCVDINRGEMWDGCVEGKTGDGSWILWLWNGIFCQFSKKREKLLIWVNGSHSSVQQHHRCMWVPCGCHIWYKGFTCTPIPIFSFSTSSGTLVQIASKYQSAIWRMLPERNYWSTSCTKPFTSMRFVCKLVMQWGDCCGVCVDINGGETWDGCMEGKTRGCSWILWLWNGVFANWVIREGSCLFEWTAATVAHDNVMNACGIS